MAGPHTAMPSRGDSTPRADPPLRLDAALANIDTLSVFCILNTLDCISHIALSKYLWNERINKDDLSPDTLFWISKSQEKVE